MRVDNDNEASTRQMKNQQYKRAISLARIFLYILVSPGKRNIAMCVMLCLCLNLMASQKHSAEVERTIEQIYEYSFTDMDKALAMTDQLRKSGKIDAHQADEIEGDLFLNQGNYFESLKFYKRILYSDDAQSDPTLQKRMIRRMLMCYDDTHNLEKMDYYQKQLEQLARQTKDTAMQAVAVFNKGKLEHYMGRHTYGCRLIKQAAETMEHSSFKGRINETYYYLISLIEFLQQDGANQEALKELNGLKRYVDRYMTGREYDEPFLKSIRRDINAHEAVIYQRLGMKNKASQAYAEFLSAHNVLEYDFKCIMPYLTTKHLYDDIIRLSHERINYLQGSGYDASADLCFVFRSMGDAYMHKGNYAEAAQAYRRLDSIRENVQVAEEHSAIDELTMNYESNRDKLEMERRMSRLKIDWIGGTALAALLALSFIAWRERRNARVIIKKNQWMARHIDRLQQEANANTSKEETHDESTDTDSEYLLFERLRKTIVSEKLYLNKDLSREVLLEKTKVPKNKFAKLFRTYANTTYNKFINDLRLDHAVGLLHQHDNYTIDAISNECGFTSTSTFYTLFSQRFGMTPTEYKKAISHA